jgi:hypothetical protein
MRNVMMKLENVIPAITEDAQIVRDTFNYTKHGCTARAYLC